MSKRVVVIGAGVVGLSTALALQQKGFRVTVLAKWLPGDMHIEYTSPWAGAHWRTMAPNSNKLLQEFDAVTYRKWMEFSETLPHETGIMVVPSTDYFDELTPDTKTPWFQNLVKNFEFVPENELPPGAKIGYRYTTMVVNAPHYLHWLQHQFKSAGGIIVRRRLLHIRDAFELDDGWGAVDAVVNCTGLGARYLGGVADTTVYPTRGQTVIAYAPHVKETITHLGSNDITYIIPRSDGTVVLGGTANKHDFNPNAEKATINSILTRTERLFPKLTEGGSKPIQLVRNGVGLRPSRVDGPRIESEIYRKSNGQEMSVVHAYGHGGFGYQSSWGAAQYTSELVHKTLNNHEAKL
ncbi:hypothetical protein BDB00DRAFT_840341 [Zychaea mexicana]|uniref:uncharacterized protein n=1 Tax=Zychaea mexicana TaxID=64656 RepID=UPI0022FE85B5|nr:uncharacterized protein BDB00DRAFT_840341 [Zychaea mexicana]KAI9489980.1 hypothetical protein BDB00DRAFT_840341 [Zychaea mexicana]